MGGIGSTTTISAWMRAFEGSASAVVTSANQPTETPTTTSDGLIDGMVGMQFDAAGVHLGIQVVRAQDDMLGTLLDLRA